jgi:protein O-GlcNAc transferase
LNRALALKPGLAKAWLEGGIVLRELGRLGEAFGTVNKAVELDPALAEAWFEIGSLELKRKNYPDALSAFRRAAELRPGMAGVEGACFRAQMAIFDWQGFEIQRENLLASFRAGNPVLPPFFFVAVFDQPEDQLRCARMWAWPASAQTVWKGERYDHPRIRIAYMSADFHEHPVAVQIAGMLEHHDRSRFEITGISVGPKDESKMRKRLQAGFERFIDAAALSDAKIADLVRELETDILVDLSGATEGARTRVYAKRCAPIQVNYLGYPGTMGTDYHDYIIADRTIIPEHHRQHYSEKVVYLPNSYMPTDDTREISEARFARAELGLPADAFVYCCFNNNYKISPAVFDIWMRILARVDGSVLWLHERAARAADSLRREASARGVDPERLVFAERMPRLADHLARHRAADLFIDTFPFNAHTTAVDALWAGLPVLTCMGESFAGRVAGSLLHAIGLPELIATTAEEYERRAIELGADIGQLQALKQQLVRNRQATPLFATASFTRGIEDAFIRMHERHFAGLAPDHIDLSR